MDTTLLQGFIDQNPVITYVAVIGLLLPIVLAVITQSSWRSEVKGLLLYVFAFAAAAGWYAVHTWQTEKWVITGVAIMGLSLAIYQGMKPAFKGLSARTDVSNEP